MLTVLSFALCNAHVRAYSSACWKVVVGGRLFVSIMLYVLLFRCPSIVAYPVSSSSCRGSGGLCRAAIYKPGGGHWVWGCLGCDERVVSESSNTSIQS
jgi:hypothetical protein